MDGGPTTPEDDGNIVRRHRGGRTAQWDRSALSNSLRSYSNTSVLQKMAVKILAFHLPQREIRGLRDLFVAIDSDCSGTISFAELCDAVATFEDTQQQMTSELQHIFSAINTSHTADISYSDFIAACMWQRITFDENHLHIVFNALDVGNRGFIDAKSVKAIAGLDFDARDIDAMIAVADHNGNGRIAFADFIHQLWRCRAIDAHYSPLFDDQELPPHPADADAAGAVSPEPDTPTGDAAMVVKSAEDAPCWPHFSQRATPAGAAAVVQERSSISSRTSECSRASTSSRASECSRSTTGPSSPAARDAEDERASGASGGSAGFGSDREAPAAPVVNAVVHGPGYSSDGMVTADAHPSVKLLGKRRSEESPHVEDWSSKPGFKRKPASCTATTPQFVASGGASQHRAVLSSDGQTTDSESGDVDQPERFFSNSNSNSSCDNFNSRSDPTTTMAMELASSQDMAISEKFDHITVAEVPS